MKLSELKQLVIDLEFHAKQHGLKVDPIITFWTTSSVERALKNPSRESFIDLEPDNSVEITGDMSVNVTKQGDYSIPLKLYTKPE